LQGYLDYQAAQTTGPESDREARLTSPAQQSGSHSASAGAPPDPADSRHSDPAEEAFQSDQGANRTGE